MDDRELERTLARRLGDYEEQIPVDTQPEFVHARARGRRVGLMAVAFAVVGAGAVVGLLAAVTVFAPREPNVASGPSVPPSLPAATPSWVPSVPAVPTQTEAVSVVPTATTSTATQPPVSQPTATPSSGLPAGEWTVVASRGDGGAVDHVYDVTYGAAGFLAVGARLEPDDYGSYGVTQVYAWRSVDGVVWEEVAPPPLRTVPGDLWVTPSGVYVAAGQVPGGSHVKNYDVLSSVDGITWGPANTTLPTDVGVSAVDRGARGYLLRGSRMLGSSRTLGLATDGLDWEMVHDFVPAYEDGDLFEIDDIGAGAEGFVALGWRRTDDVYERFAFASGDGREWVETRAPFGPESFAPFAAEPENAAGTAALTPLGPDWVAVVPEQDGALQVWTSANGIAWERGTTIGTVDMSSAGNPVLLNIEDTLYLSMAGGQASPGSTGAWSSTDGVTWTPLDIGAGAASDAAVGAGVVVMTGHQVADGGNSIATIWASPAE